MKNISILILLFTTSIQLQAQCLIEKVKKLDFFIANKTWEFTAVHRDGIHELNTKMGVDTLSLVSWCKNDTMYMTRKPFLVDEKNNNWWIYGVQKIPMKLEIGQSIEPHSDYAIMADVTKEGRSDVKTMKSDWDGGNTITTTIRTFNVATKSTVNMNSEMISGMNSKVIAYEDITIGDKIYKAYKIDYEIWLKPGYKIKFEYNSKGMNTTDAKQVEEQNKKINEKLEKNINKNLKGYTNSKGYVVMPRTDWFVPGLGWVRAHTFDSQRIFEKDKAYVSNIICN